MDNEIDIGTVEVGTMHMAEGHQRHEVGFYSSLFFNFPDGSCAQVLTCDHWDLVSFSVSFSVNTKYDFFSWVYI